MIVLTFANPNSRNLTQIDIYRSDIGVPIPDEPTDDPIGSVSGMTTTFTDTNTTEGLDYNYRLRVYKPGGDSAMSETFVLGDVSRYGPGKYNSPSSGTNTVWIYDIVEQSDLLPSLEDVLAIAGPNAIPVNWTGQWLKFRIGPDIYFTPYQFYAKLDKLDAGIFMSNASSGSLLSKGYIDYTVGNGISDADALAIFDGATPTVNNIAKEYNRLNASRAAAQSDADTYISRVVFSLTSPTQMRLMVPNVGLGIYAGSQVIAGNATQFDSFQIYWKPTFKFMPKSVRNNI